MEPVAENHREGYYPLGINSVAGEAGKRDLNGPKGPPLQMELSEGAEVHYIDGAARVNVSSVNDGVAYFSPNHQGIPVRRRSRREICVGEGDGFLPQSLYRGHMSDFPHVKRLSPLLSLAGGIAPCIATSDHEDVAFFLLVVGVLLLFFFQVSDLPLLAEGDGVRVYPSVYLRVVPLGRSLMRRPLLPRALNELGQVPRLYQPLDGRL
ncbi:unnamed protein product [Cuscuta europaea]|uniref:Uncharacterized protein n=1 Tax=Cuscuta europaea TaxID=41803 RepID=A0A9P0Z352_CUSEU|nr:unnamed protein product [Cuscuta europaea]